MEFPLALEHHIEHFYQSIESIKTAYNANIIENNQVITQADSLEASNINLTDRVNALELLLQAKDETISAQESKIQNQKEKEKVKQVCADVLEVTKIEKNNIVELEQLRRERKQETLIANDANIQLTAYKALGSAAKILAKRKEDKKARELQVTRYNVLKEENKTLQHNLNKTQAANKELKREQDGSGLMKVYQDGDDTLFIHPNQVEVTEDNGKTRNREVVLLYLNKSAKGGLMSLDTEEQTLSFPIVKGSSAIRPKAETKRHGAMLLRKWKAQGWQISHEDIL